LDAPPLKPPDLELLVLPEVEPVLGEVTLPLAPPENPPDEVEPEFPCDFGAFWKVDPLDENEPDRDEVPGELPFANEYEAKLTEVLAININAIASDSILLAILIFLTFFKITTQSR